MIRNFSLFKNTSKPTATPYSAKVYTTQSYTDLLKTPARNTLINKIKFHVGTTDSYYQALYRPVIDTLGNYLQCLPDIRTFQTQHERLWLDTALIRCAYATKIRHHLNLPPNGDEQTRRQNYALWTYVFFSASLLWHIGKLSTDFVVGMCDETGEVHKHWKPLVQSLYTAGSRYKIQNINIVPCNKYKTVTPILARNMMPSDGFEWIASDETALEYWLNALVEEGGAQGKLVEILTLVDRLLLGAISLEEFIQLLNLDLSLEQFKKLKDELSDIDKLIRDFDAEQFPPVEFTEPPETAIGEQFFEWLKRGIENNTIAYNTDLANIQIHKDGVVLAYPGIFKEFCRSFHLFKDWVVVYKQFNMLGITKKGGSDTWFSKYFVDLEDVDPGKYRQKDLEGVTVNNTRALYGQRKMEVNKRVTREKQQVNQKAQIQQNMTNLDQANKKRNRLKKE